MKDHDGITEKSFLKTTFKHHMGKGQRSKQAWMLQSLAFP
jgi:hypothetical protein